MRTYVSEIKSKVGENIRLKGWVKSLRKFGKFYFLVLRDSSGEIQCIGSGKPQDIMNEAVVEIDGIVKERQASQINKDQEYGKYEIEIDSCKLLNTCKQLPIPIDGDGYDISEDIRFRYRYLDLRRERLGKIIKLRSDFIQNLRNNLYDFNFTEIETPILTAPTMEGAKCFYVPSRLYPSKFYALPQSPQQYKQLLMTAGIDRYFQVAKCIRDEDLRADRGFEFTQLDLEMSFVERSDVMKTVEKVIVNSVKAVGGKLKQEPFPIIDYNDALKKYGADKFDLRTEEEKRNNLLAFAWVINFPFFKRKDTADKAEQEDTRSQWTYTHNPFSTPIPEHLEWHLKGENVSKIITNQYDLVCNGFEVGGGSIRAHKADVLKATYKIMGYTEEELIRSIGHMLEAFELGTPPHGGIALGIDRLIMILANEKSLKDTIAFPMTNRGNVSVMDAPAELNENQLKEFGIKKIK